MQLNKLLGQGKSKPSPFSLVRIVASHLAEFLENLCLVLSRDPDPGVADRNLHKTISLPGIDSDPSSLWRELHRVGKQVEKDLLDLALVATKVSKALVNCNIKVDTVLDGSFAHKGPSVVYGQGQIERSHFKLHPPSLHLGKVQDLVDKREQVATGGEDVLGVLGLFLV